MNRKPMKRPAPPARPPATQSTYTARARRVAVARGEARMSVPMPKAKLLIDEKYRRWVASLPCMHCGIEGHSQAAHGDYGKGMGFKTSDDTCYPACGPHFAESEMVVGCHYLIGTAGNYAKGQRRGLESRYAAQTRALWEERKKGAA